MTRLAPFALHRPDTLAEASELLLEHGADAAVHAGGTELLLLMKLGLATFDRLIDIKRIAGLDSVAVDERGTLSIGTTATHRRIERSPLVRHGWSVLADIEGSIANVRVRSTGTLGGNLCFADPHSDPSTWLLVADASVRLGTAASTRTLPIADFLLGPWQTALEPGELLLAVEVPQLPADARTTHVRFATHERPTATVSCLVRVSDRAVSEARIAVGSVGPRHVRATVAEGLLAGLSVDHPDDARLREAGMAAAAAADPDTDSNGSAAYKSDLVAVLVERAVRQALVGSAIARA